MTELSEPVAIGDAAFSQKKGQCWYCEKEPTGDLVNKEKADPDTTDSESTDECAENDVDNNSSNLGQNLGSQPTWNILHPVNNTDNTTVLSAAHHCIPGEASLAKAKTLHRFMRIGGPFKYVSDIGYDVNSKANGVWLPGNYAVRPGQYGWNKKWSGYQSKFKNEYSKRAMDKAKRQFHDAHVSYNTKVRKSLETLASRLGKPKDKCPVCKKALEKNRPPYGLVGRLDWISNAHRRMLINLSKKSIKHVQNGYYTSSRVKKYFDIE